MDDQGYPCNFTFFIFLRVIFLSAHLIFVVPFITFFPSLRHLPFLYFSLAPNLSFTAIIFTLFTMLENPLLSLSFQVILTTLCWIVFSVVASAVFTLVVRFSHFFYTQFRYLNLIASGVQIICSFSSVS